MNCLITKLKGVVSDDNIPYLGEVSYKLNSPNENGYLHAVFNGEINWEASSPITVNGTVGTRGTASAYIHITPGNNVNPVEVKTWPSYDISSYEINGISSVVDISKQRKQGNIIIKPGTTGAVVVDTKNQSYVLEGIQSYPIGLPIPKDLNLKSNFSVNLPNNNPVRLGVGTTEIMDGLTEYIEGGDVTNMLATSLIPYLDTFAFNIITPLYNKLTVGNIENFSSFVNLEFISLGLIPIVGDIAEALKPLLKLTTFISQGESDVYELSTVFNNWKLLGKTNASVQFYVNKALCRINNAQPSTGHFYVDFDANGDWTIRYV